MLCDDKSTCSWLWRLCLRLAQRSEFVVIRPMVTLAITWYLISHLLGVIAPMIVIALDRFMITRHRNRAVVGSL